MSGSNDPSGKTGTGSLLLNGPGTLTLDADNTPGSSSDPSKAGFTGGVTIDQGTLDLAVAGAAGSGAITFGSTTAHSLLEFSANSAPANAIQGFGGSDLVLITGYAATGESYNNGVLHLTETGGPTIDLKISGPNISGLSSFHINVDKTNDITTIACYCRGTSIDTEHGRRQIETLNIGDKIRTASGALRPIKWLGSRSYGGRFILGRKDVLPVCFKAGSLGDNVPARDLWISPQHAVFIDDMLIEAKDLINGVSIVQAEHVDTVDYFHIEFDTHDVILAEGALSETFIDDDSRGIFHNAHEYETLYAPEHASPAHYYAPRLSEGYEVEVVRQRLALRAGLLHAPEAPRLGALRGHIDAVEASYIKGWAQNTAHPEAPVCLDIIVDGNRIGQVLANRYREDLAQAGLGSGRHGFVFRPPAGVTLASGAVQVRRSHDGADLLVPAHTGRRRASDAA